MADYVIGDVQGCLDSLHALLERIEFTPGTDQLWFAGDLVNRGPRSLDTLRFIRGLHAEGHAHTVLGNHDLHLLALAAGHGRVHRSDTIASIIDAPDSITLIDWLRQQPLALTLPSPSGPALLTHAGVLPSWSFDTALRLSAEVQAVLAAPDWASFMAVLYGNKPRRWDDALEGADRLRLIVNVFTRMRMIEADGALDLKFKLEPQDAPEGLMPWFAAPRSAGPQNGTVYFGHWSTLPHIHNGVSVCLDTGCVWGGKLSAFRLQDDTLFQVNALETPVPSIE